MQICRSRSLFCCVELNKYIIKNNACQTRRARRVKKLHAARAGSAHAHIQEARRPYGPRALSLSYIHDHAPGACFYMLSPADRQILTPDDIAV